jgi:hypothetical protein
VNVSFDENSRCYFVVASDIEGLHAEAASAGEIGAQSSDQAKAILGVPAVEVRSNLPGARQTLIGS